MFDKIIRVVYNKISEFSKIGVTAGEGRLPAAKTGKTRSRTDPSPRGGKRKHGHSRIRPRGGYG